MAAEELGGLLEMVGDWNGVVGDGVAGEVGEDLEYSDWGFVFEDFAVGFHDSDGVLLDHQTVTHSFLDSIFFHHHLI